MLVQLNKVYSKTRKHFFLWLVVFTSMFGLETNVLAQCQGVRISSVTLSVVERPCGPTESGVVLLQINGGLAPYTLSWKINDEAVTFLPTLASKNDLAIENLKGAMNPGYQVTVKDACGNESSSKPLQLINSVPIQFVGSPRVKTQVSKKGEQNGSLLVELRGGTPPRTLMATDSQGRTFSQQFPIGPPEIGTFKYELANLPEEKYKIELKSGSEKCTQVWKEMIELKAREK